jgi:hypothetical protein
MNGIDPVIVATGNDWRAWKPAPMPMPAAGTLWIADLLGKGRTRLAGG